MHKKYLDNLILTQFQRLVSLNIQDALCSTAPQAVSSKGYLKVVLLSLPSSVMQC